MYICVYIPHPLSNAIHPPAPRTAPGPTAAAVALTVRAALPPRPLGQPQAHGGSGGPRGSGALHPSP